jgi:lipoprotein NlpI
LERAISLDGSNVATRNDLALTHSMLGMFDEAKAGFTTVLEMDPSNEVAKKNIVFFE